MRKVLIAPSILSADFNKLGEELKSIESAGAEYVHFDVMDGHFVPNISFGIPVLKSISHSHHMVNDVHLMIENPMKYIPEFIKAGADIVTFHYEALKDPEEIIDIVNFIHSQNKKAGISIKPKTDPGVLEKYLSMLDLVLVMSVEPGFGGQSFMESALDKIRYYRSEIDKHSYKALIEVDGGINEETGRLCKEAGVDILVAGSYIFGSKDYQETIRKLR